MGAASLHRTGTGPADPLRVMVVDDSAVVRGLLTRLLEADGGISVVASVADGRAALAAATRTDPEVVVLDVDTPVMDGLAALPRLMAARPGLQVLISSTLTRQDAEIGLEALTAGASDWIARPGARIMAADTFRSELLDKVKSLGWAARRRGRARAGGRGPAGAPAPTAAAPAAARPAGPPAVIAIGSSTGGPQALVSVLRDIGPALTVPVLITQHMPPTFTTIMARHLARAAGAEAAEARDGEPVRGGRIYVAPGGFHMTVTADGRDRALRLDQAPPENFCRPAVDPMLRSVARAYGRRALAVILTGMGRDGAAGARAVAEAGGTVVAQDEPTSVVWGMPGAAVEAGVCDAVLPLGEIGPYLRRAMGGCA